MIKAMAAGIVWLFSLGTLLVNEVSLPVTDLGWRRITRNIYTELGTRRIEFVDYGVPKMAEVICLKPTIEDGKAFIQKVSATGYIIECREQVEDPGRRILLEDPFAKMTN